MNEKILVIDDDLLLHQFLRLALGSRGLDVVAAGSGQEGLRLAYDTHPGLIILDMMMPGMDGLETCRRLRGLTDAPIVMLSAMGEDQDVVAALKLGADDYVRKPFNLDELHLRICSMLRRTQPVANADLQIYRDNILSLDMNRRRVERHGKPIHLTPLEFRLLACLVRRQQQVVSHGTLLREVWGEGYQDAEACLSLYVHQLRAKIEENPNEPEYIRTEWGVGYWFAARAKEAVN